MRKRRKKPPLNNDGCGATCAYCARVLLATTAKSDLQATRDHIKPKCIGGVLRVWACLKCNAIKADMTVKEWDEFRRVHPEWWRLPTSPVLRAIALRQLLVVKDAPP